MKQPFEEIVSVVLIIGLIASFCGSVNADSEVMVTGAVNEDGQLIGDDGVIYEIAENEMGNDMVKFAGQQVAVEGMLLESDEILMITVHNFELLD